MRTAANQPAGAGGGGATAARTQAEWDAIYDKAAAGGYQVFTSRELNKRLVLHEDVRRMAHIGPEEVPRGHDVVATQTQMGHEATALKRSIAECLHAGMRTKILRPSTVTREDLEALPRLKFVVQDVYPATGQVVQRTSTRGDVEAWYRQYISQECLVRTRVSGYDKLPMCPYCRQSVCNGGIAHTPPEGKTCGLRICVTCVVRMACGARLSSALPACPSCQTTFAETDIHMATP